MPPASAFPFPAARIYTVLQLDELLHGPLANVSKPQYIRNIILYGVPVIVRVWFKDG